MNSEIVKNLKNYKVKPTPMRMLVLEQLVLQNRGLSINELEDLLYPADRITIFRTLNTFEKAGMVHKIDSESKEIHFALCKQNCERDKHTDNHPHFYCKKCKKILCLDSISVEVIKLYDLSLKIDDIKIELKGICQNCIDK